MRRLLTGYAISFNRRHKRHGHLFQNRYKSVICQEDAYLRELVRYIHLNPVRASIVSDIGELNGYAYCGHSALMGKKNRPWHDVEYVLGYFGQTVRSFPPLPLFYFSKALVYASRIYESMQSRREIRRRDIWCLRKK
ncbi:MAG: hypothetical protein AUK23_11730 [Deltaproteobacteria bacterium CG2_30_43_15]|nr:MAG: hypothetical protein AUK23_11730 [Deltaproteobacteria bacterium CG2_30_43_15]